MVMTEYAKSGTALLLYGNGVRPSYTGIGSGSGTPSIFSQSLAYETDRNAFTGSVASISKEVTFLTDFGSVEMSGTFLRQFGTFSESSGGKPWNIEGFPAVEFDGTNELQVQTTIRIF